MLSTIVVPLDGSLLAERALPYAIRLAQARQARLVLMRAALAPPPMTLDGAGWEREQAEAIDEAERYLAEIADSASGQLSSIEIAAPYGRAAAQILETARRYRADGVVMATHGRTGLPHLLYGSVTEAVLAESNLPVLVVHAQPGEKAARLFTPYAARVLVTQDGSKYDAPALRAAQEILGLRGELVLVTVIPPPERVLRDESGRVLAYIDQLEAADRVEAQDYLSRVAHTLCDRPLPVKVRIDVRVGDPASEIATAAIEFGADLIVMATHGRTGIRRAILGSVAGTVLRSGPTPVLLVHPPEVAAATAGPKAYLLAQTRADSAAARRPVGIDKLRQPAK